MDIFFLIFFGCAVVLDDIADAQRSILIPAMVFWCTYNILYLPIMSAFCVLERNDGGGDA
ncbi:hypothetical protein [Klebsiella aerogenes]